MSQKKKFSGSLNLILGPMYSGKTSMLIMRYNRYIISGKKCIMVKYKNDTRYDDKMVVTHNGVKVQAISCEELADIDQIVKNYDVVCIDEVQFYKDAHIFCDKWANLGIIVEAAGLNGTFARKPFEVISMLVPLANSLSSITAICRETGADAIYSKRNTDDKEVELIGGSDIYSAADRETFFGASDNWYRDNFLEYSKIYCAKRDIHFTDRLRGLIKGSNIDRQTNYKKLMARLTSNSLKYAILKGKNVILRMDTGNHGKVYDTSDYYYYKVSRSMNYILQEQCNRLIILCSSSTYPQLMSYIIGSLIGYSVTEWNDIYGQIPDSKVIIVTQLDSFDEDKNCSYPFCQRLQELCDVYVNDDFNNCHKNYASIVGIRPDQRHMGFQFETEYKYLCRIFNKVGRKLAIICGSNIIDNLKLLRNMIRSVNAVIIGGDMIYTFLKYAYEMNIGSSPIDQAGFKHIADLLELAKENKVNLYLPIDILCNDFKTVCNIEEGLLEDQKGIDIGPNSIEYFNAIMSDANIIIWNGVFGNIHFDNNSTKQMLQSTVNMDITKILVGNELSQHSRSIGFGEDFFEHMCFSDEAAIKLLSGETMASIELLR